MPLLSIERNKYYTLGLVSDGYPLKAGQLVNAMG